MVCAFAVWRELCDLDSLAAWLEQLNCPTWIA